MANNGNTVILVSIICFTVFMLGTMFLQIVRENSETPYEECLDVCTQIWNRDAKVNCIKECNNIVKEIVFDITDSFDNFDWEAVMDNRNCEVLE